MTQRQPTTRGRSRARTNEKPPRSDDQQRSRLSAVKQYYDVQMRVILGGEPMHLTVCAACCAVIPSGAKAQQRHFDWHQLLQEALDSALPR
jgi:hypothetical protein